MIYMPNPKELVYNELYFISTSVPRKPASISIFAAMEEIVDAVSGEIYELFIGAPMEVAPATGTETIASMEMLFGVQISN